MNFQFTQYVSDTDAFAQVIPLKTAAQQLGLVSARLGNKGNGNFVVLTKADGTSKVLPCSKEMTTEQMEHARLGCLKEKAADGSEIWIVIRPEGISNVFTKTVHF